ncbi:MAG: PAS domain S-box protein, partial [Thermoplasmata archaeon]|nr:PAS domain S-box protein [Thermoplasmata archaeon]
MINEGSNTSWNSQAEMVSSIIDQSPNALAVIEVGGIISFANRKFSEIYAPTLGNPVGMNWRNFISSTATIRRKYNEIADRVFNQKKVWKGEISDIDVNGNTIWRHSTFFPILDKDGNPLRVIYISEDITERKEAEESLRKSEEWNRDIVEHLNDLVYQYDKDFKLMYASPQLVKLVGYKADEVIGTNLDFIISDDYHSQQTSKDFRNRAKKSKKPVKKRDTVKLIHKNGRAIDVEVYRSSMHDIDGRFTGIIGAITDITERKKAEEALQESEEKHKLLVESSLQAILIRQNDEFIFANLAAEHIGGYSKEEYYSMTPQQISELIHPDDR